MSFTRPLGTQKPFGVVLCARRGLARAVKILLDFLKKLFEKFIYNPDTPVLRVRLSSCGLDCELLDHSAYSGPAGLMVRSNATQY